MKTTVIKKGFVPTINKDDPTKFDLSAGTMAEYDTTKTPPELIRTYDLDKSTGNVSVDDNGETKVIGKLTGEELETNNK